MEHIFSKINTVFNNTTKINEILLKEIYINGNILPYKYSINRYVSFIGNMDSFAIKHVDDYSIKYLLETDDIVESKMFFVGNDVFEIEYCILGSFIKVLNANYSTVIVIKKLN